LGSVFAHGARRDLAIMSDGAGQFNVYRHILCWIHAERGIKKLVGFSEAQRVALDRVRDEIWTFYRELKAAPNPAKKAELRTRFGEIFRQATCFEQLNAALDRIAKHEAELLRVLQRPELPLHNNLSESDILFSASSAEAARGVKRATSVKVQVPRKPATLLKSATRLTTPYLPVGADESYLPSNRNPITIVRTGTGKKPISLFWFPGSGQAPTNEMIGRFANAFHEAGLALRIYSMPYHEERAMAEAISLIKAQRGKVLLGSHSAGGSAVNEVLEKVHGKIAGGIAINSHGDYDRFGIPALFVLGENDYGRESVRSPRSRSPELSVVPF
jgi:hypothetical protein